MSKFSIKDNMLNNISKVAEKNNNLEAKESFKIEYIDIDKIQKNPLNFYEIVNIDELAEDIKLNGLNHNIVVNKLEDGNYRIISGERRFTALHKLVFQEGLEKFRLVPSKIVEVNEVDEEIILIQANAQGRELTEKEKLKQVQRLTELYKEKKANGEKVPGRVVELVANDLALSKTQVGRYTTINNNLIPELKELIQDERLTIANASEFAILNEESQKAVLEIINNKIDLTKQEALKLKNEMKKLEDEKETEKQRLIDELNKIQNEKNIEKTQVDKYKNQTEQASKEIENLKEINKKLSDDKEKLMENQKNQIEEIEKKVDNKYKEELEKLKGKVQTSKEQEEKLKQQLQKSKENKIEYEVIKENIDVEMKLKNIVSQIATATSKIKSFRESKMEVKDETLKQASYLSLRISDLQKEISELLKDKKNEILNNKEM